MQISSLFDSGNIRVIRAEQPDDIMLAINKDNQSDFYQWFHFRLTGEVNRLHTLHISDLASSAYPKGWEGYNVLASYDRQTWFRVDSEFNGDILTFSIALEQPQVYFAYFIPYSYERHLDLLADAQCSPLCELKYLGDTLDGRDMSMLVIGEPGEDKRNIWITARQHPGESMAEWCAEGIIARLLDEQDGLSRALLEKAVFYIVPNMNPDGSARGHLRTNAVGANLNREWKTPTLERSPEVYYVLNAMHEVGVDMYLDLHGDEALPYNFVAGSEGIPAYNDKLKALENQFKDALLMATPEFQDEFGYAKDEPGQADLTIASNAVGQAFECLAYTIEMPFKDNNNLPDPLFGWSVQRCQQFGEDILVAAYNVVGSLRT
ncbi:M14-type cytosolic carboxypeptidase [Alteromonas oceani]|uniref:M14-type cytosolic carboxypeptidase n=1 Tax=Alteromonas oceani TaxID=2071609 RepID=A0ABV7K0A0_9ALTE|nr:M14-type cytosolic carboxypeptidase [Alteromonas oceani]MDG6099140.1 carboxypeptidase family protein [Alteromonas sp. ZYF713]